MRCEPRRTRDLAGIEQLLQQFGFRLHDAAREFLIEHHSLAMDVPIAGVTGVAGRIQFSPEFVLRLLRPGDPARLARLMPRSACPIGTTGGHTVFVFMDDAGRSYLLDMDWELFAELAGTPSEMLQVLCDGRNGRVDSHILDADGQLTDKVIQAGDERRHWCVDRFTALAPFLPTESLSPARRPPTWRPMVKAAEAVLKDGLPPSGLMVTPGGFCRGASGEMYFVAHCENSLYVRAKAGFRLAPLPPGISRELHVGEMVPFQPPWDWLDRRNP